MTGYESKRASARDKLEDDDTLTIAYQSGYYDGKKAAAQEPAIGDIRALKHRIHELEGEVIGYKQILDAQPAQEPVAWCSQCGHKCPLPAQEPDTYRSVPHGHCTHPRCKEVFSAYIEVNKRLAHYEPEGKSPMILNAAPPQRKPLTDEEIDKAWRSCDYTVPWEQHRIDIARAIEAAHDIKE